MCALVERHQCFRWVCRPLPSAYKINLPWRCKQPPPPKRWHISTKLHEMSGSRIQQSSVQIPNYIVGMLFVAKADVSLHSQRADYITLHISLYVYYSKSFKIKVIGSNDVCISTFKIGVCSTQRGDKKWLQNFDTKTWVEGTLGRPRIDGKIMQERDKRDDLFKLPVHERRGMFVSFWYY